MSQDSEKELVAKNAVKLVQNNMKIGIGTGSTIRPFIAALKKHIEANDLQISCIATSLQSKSLLKGHLPLLNERLVDFLDCTFDGADRVDPENFVLIKGGGGALLREKLVALRSKKNIILVDHTKISKGLLGFALPLEIVPFGYKSTEHRLNLAGFGGSFRMQADGSYALSDNHNYIFDIDIQKPIQEPYKLYEVLKMITGVIEVGLFIGTTTEVHVAKENGTIEVLKPL